MVLKMKRSHRGACGGGRQAGCWGRHRSGGSCRSIEQQNPCQGQAGVCGAMRIATRSLCPRRHRLQSRPKDAAADIGLALWGILGWVLPIFKPFLKFQPQVRVLPGKGRSLLGNSSLPEEEGRDTTF